MQRLLAINDNLLAIGLKSLIILSLSLILGYFIVEAKLLFILIFVVLLTSCYYFIHERNFIYMILFLPLEHLIILETGFADLRLIQILFAVVLASLACKKYIFHRQIRFFEKTRVDMSLLLMLASYIISSIFSFYLKDNIREILQLIYLICLFKFFASVLDSDEKLDKALKIWVVGVVLLVVNILTVRWIGTTLIPKIIISAETGVTFIFRKLVIKTFYSAPNINYMVSSVVGFGTPGIAFLSITAIFLLLGFWQKARETLGQKIIWGTLLVLVFMSFVFSYSRTGIMALLIGCGLLSLAKRKLTHLFLLLFVFLYIVVFPTSLHYRFLESFTVEEASFKSHLTSWGTCIEMFLERPLVGFGPGSYAQIGEMYSVFWNNITDPHSFIFLIGAETGIIGLLAVCWFVVSVLRQGWKGFWNQKPSTALSNMKAEVFAVLVSCFILAATAPVFLAGYFWGFMGIVYAMSANSSCAPPICGGYFIPNIETKC